MDSILKFVFKLTFRLFEKINFNRVNFRDIAFSKYFEYCCSNFVNRFSFNNVLIFFTIKYLFEIWIGVQKKFFCLKCIVAGMSDFKDFKRRADCPVGLTIKQMSTTKVFKGL